MCYKQFLVPVCSDEVLKAGQQLDNLVQGTGGIFSKLTFREALLLEQKPANKNLVNFANCEMSIPRQSALLDL